ncbi:MAG: PQQ-dependent sugar dehydrogenase [Myxococcota bacterium]
MYRLLIPVTLAIALAACPDPADTDVDTDTDADTDTDTEPEVLRPNVQEGISPEAEGQTPAFPEQTRAPQPAEATAWTSEVFASGLGVPWGIAPLPDGRLLVTQRAGSLFVVNADGSVGPPMTGVPSVVAQGQGGLLDVAIDPDFSNNGRIYLTFAEDRGGGLSAPTVARGVLNAGNDGLDDVTILFRQTPAWNTTRHFGSRLVFGDDGTLFATFGDRGSAFTDAQDPNNAIGAVIRINTDGSVPADNPFADGVGGAPEVWSYGHRNIQSATWGADGALWTVEHGAKGGDELNRPKAGDNHGWPIISYGEDYNGSPIGDGSTAKDGLAQPMYYWDPVIAPSGMATYTGGLFDGWDGDLLIGGLRSEGLVRLSLRDGQVYTEEWFPLGVRVRSVAIAADGAVLVGTDAGQIVRIVPEG